MRYTIFGLCSPRGLFADPLGYDNRTMEMELRPMHVGDALPDSGPIDEAHERVRQALYDYLVSLDASVVRQMLSEHMRQCTLPCCPTCTRVRERAAQRRQEKKQKLDKRMSRWRGVSKSIGPLLAARHRAAEVAYAPGGLGHQAARESFEGLVCKECKH